MSDIKFGTDGFRAVTGKDFNYENVDKILNAIAIYVYKHSNFNHKILISYDPRNKADEFAFYIAKKLAGFGFVVEIADKITATPVLAYAALNRNAYAIMLTASHNPPEYLGIKFIPQYGGPADDSIVKEITDNLENKFLSNLVSQPAAGSSPPSYCPPFQVATPKNSLGYRIQAHNVHSSRVRFVTPLAYREFLFGQNIKEHKEYKKVSFDEEYLNHIKNLIDFEKIKNSCIKVNYDGHHGAAAKLFKKILDDNNIENNSTNLERDINFGGYMPDPKEKYLPSLKKTCYETSCIGLSNDGDGDRFGVFNEKGEFVSANDIIAILLKHLILVKSFSGKLAKTVGASSLLNVAAEKLNVEVVETPVGFKWLGNAMRNDNIIIAGEESGGLSIKGHIPEKDGIIANLLILEAMAYSGKKLFELQQELYSSIDCVFINNRIDMKLDSINKQQQIIDKFKTLNTIGIYRIIHKNTMDGLKLHLEEGSWILIRKSGTEPLLRIYFETNKEEKLSYLEEKVRELC